MKAKDRVTVGVTTTEQSFTSAAVTVGSLYLATHSIVATITGTVAATAVCGWGMWLSHQRDRAIATVKGPTQNEGLATGDNTVTAPLR